MIEGMRLVDALLNLSQAYLSSSTNRKLVFLFFSCLNRIEGL